MKKEFCDRCQKESTHNREYPGVMWDVDLCLDCSKELRKILDKFLEKKK